MGLRNHLEELGFKQDWPTMLYGDSEACIKMTKSAVSNSNLRHIKNDRHFIRQCVREQEIIMLYCRTKDMLADLETKALPRQQFEEQNDRLHNHL